MTEITAREIHERRDALENAGATLLGRLLFEFARLDMNLGLCLVWLEGGSRLEALSEKVPNWGFSQRLDYLDGAVARTHSVQHEGRIEYSKWIARSRLVRKTRNELVHGRWVVSANAETLINILGLPTSPGQRSVAYTLGELDECIEEMKALQRVLSELRRRWPL